jgi:hypothetical protein
MTELELQEETTSIDYANPLQDQLEYLVYNDEYELDPSNLILLHVSINICVWMSINKEPPISPFPNFSIFDLDG